MPRRLFVIACVMILTSCTATAPPTATELAAVDTLFAEFAEFVDGDIPADGPCPFDANGRLLIERLTVLCIDDDAIIDDIGHRVTRGVTVLSQDGIEQMFVEDGFDSERRDDDGNGDWLLIQGQSRVIGIALHPVGDNVSGLVFLRVSEVHEAEKLMPRFQREVAGEASSWVRSLSNFTFPSLLASAGWP